MLSCLDDTAIRPNLVPSRGSFNESICGSRRSASRAVPRIPVPSCSRAPASPAPIPKSRRPILSSNALEAYEQRGAFADNPTGERAGWLKEMLWQAPGRCLRGARAKRDVATRTVAGGGDRGFVFAVSKTSWQPMRLSQPAGDSDRTMVCIWRRTAATAG